MFQLRRASEKKPGEGLREERGRTPEALIKHVIDTYGPDTVVVALEERRPKGLFSHLTPPVYVVTVDPGSAAGPEHGDGQQPTSDASPVDAAGSIVAAALAGMGGCTAALHVQEVGTADASSRTLTVEGGPGPAGVLDAREGGGRSVMFDWLIDSTEDDDLVLGAPAQGTVVRAGDGPGRLDGRGADESLPAKSFDEVLDEVASSLGEEPGTYQVGPARLHPGGRSVATGYGWPATVPPSEALGAGAPAIGALGSANLEPADLESADLEPADLATDAVLSRWVTTQPTTGGDRRQPGEPVPGVEEDTWSTMQLAAAELLLAAGFPEMLLEDLVGRLVEAQVLGEEPLLEAVFGALPAVSLPRAAGALVAVVGPATPVRETAQAVAQLVRCPVDELAIAAQRGGGRAAPGYRVRSVDKAAALADGWRRYHTGVVGVCAPALGGDQSWTKAMLMALKPTSVWGVVSATTKLVDIAAWIDTIGGVDALALYDVAATRTPAEILELGLPISRVDGHAATPMRWAQLVSALMARF